MEDNYRNSTEKNYVHHRHHSNGKHRHSHYNMTTEAARARRRRKFLANVLFACLVILALIIICFVAWLYTA